MSVNTPLGVVNAVKVLMVAAVLGIGVLLVAVQPVTSQEEDPTQEEAIAIAKPSVVFIETVWEGYVGIPGEGGGPTTWSDPITVGSVCSGFFVDPSGYVATAGHCVDPVGGKDAILVEFFTQAIDEGVVTQEDAMNLYTEALSTWPVEGESPGSAPSRTVAVYQTKALSGVEVQEPMQADVVEFTPPEQGDNALLKVETASEVPILEIAESKPEIGAEVISAGYPGSVAQVVDTAQEPSFKSGGVSSHQTTAGVPFIEIDAAVSGGMSGGPTVNLDGQAVGVNSFGILGEEQQFNFVTDTERLGSILSRNGVSQELSPTDTAYREGLAKFFDGDFAGAVEQFDLVLDAMPSHSLAQSYRTQASEDAPAEEDVALADDATSQKQAPLPTEPVEDEESNALLYVAIGVVVLLLLAALLVVLKLLKGRQTPQLVKCPQCNTFNNPGSAFCFKCGHNLNESGDAAGS